MADSRGDNLSAVRRCFFYRHCCRRVPSELCPSGVVSLVHALEDVRYGGLTGHQLH
jgi:hypothetical protein